MGTISLFSQNVIANRYLLIVRKKFRNGSFIVFGVTKKNFRRGQK